jgi:hypothetical protein
MKNKINKHMFELMVVVMCMVLVSMYWFMDESIVEPVFEMAGIKISMFYFSLLFCLVLFLLFSALQVSSLIGLSFMLGCSSLVLMGFIYHARFFSDENRFVVAGTVTASLFAGYVLISAYRLLVLKVKGMYCVS